MSKSVSDNGSTGGSRGKSRAGRGKRNESSTIYVRGDRGKWAKSSHGSSVSKNGRKKSTGRGVESGRKKNRPGSTRSGYGRPGHTKATGAEGSDDEEEDDGEFIDDSDADSEEEDLDEEERDKRPAYSPTRQRRKLSDIQDKALRTQFSSNKKRSHHSNDDSDDERDSVTESSKKKLKRMLEAKSEVDDRLQEALGICKSQAWCADFREHVRTYPEFKKENTRDNMQRGDMRLVKKCEVCNREGHPWSVVVRLTGKPYNKETYEVKEVDDDEDEDEDEDDDDDDDKDEDDEEGVQYYMGRFCHSRTKLFHNLFHFRYHLYQRCKKMLEKGRRIDQVARNSSLLNEMNIQKAEEDYKKDGKRTNNKWNQEFG